MLFRIDVIFHKRAKISETKAGNRTHRVPSIPVTRLRVLREGSRGNARSEAPELSVVHPLDRRYRSDALNKESARLARSFTSLTHSLETTVVGNRRETRREEEESGAERSGAKLVAR